MGFQKVVNLYPAPGVEGDFASMNPFSSILAGGPPGQGGGTLVAPASGVAVGRFAFVNPANGAVSQSYVVGYQIGFLGRNEQALITQFLGEYTLVVPCGFMINLFSGGDFWARFPAGATAGQKVYADPNTGLPISAASAPALASGTATIGFTGVGTASVAAGTTLTIGTATDGVLSVGDVISASNIPAGTTIVAQLTVTAGSGAGLLGTYQMSAAATGTLSGAVTSVSALAYITAVAAGAFEFGDAFTGATSPASIGLQQTPFSGVATLATSTALVVTAVTPGTSLLYVGAALPSNGGAFTPGTTIASQTSGTPGGVGTYVLSAASLVTAAGVAFTTSDSAGGTGVYGISTPQNYTGGTITVAGTAVLTQFTVASNCGANEIAKISASVS